MTIAAPDKMTAPMTEVEERALLAKWAIEKDPKIRDRFVMSVYRFCVQEAARCSSAVPLEDKVNAGVLGALRAFDKFDASRGTRFNTYAMWWVRESIWRLVGEARTLVSGTRYLGGAEQQTLNENKRRVYVESLDAYADDDGHHLHSAQRADDDALDQQRRREKLWHLLETAPLTAKEKKVIILRWLNRTGETVTLEAVGKRLGISRQRVQQLEVSAFDKIRAIEEPDEDES